MALVSTSRVMLLIACAGSNPVIFPAVAQGAARLRLCVTAAHSTSDLEYALDAFAKLAKGA